MPVYVVMGREHTHGLTELLTYGPMPMYSPPHLRALNAAAFENKNQNSPNQRIMCPQKEEIFQMNDEPCRPLLGGLEETGLRDPFVLRKNLA